MPMRSPRDTILIANRNTGAVRRLSVTRRRAGLAVAGLRVVPLVIGVATRTADPAEVEALRLTNESLRLENDSYRVATGELAEQIASLQGALSHLGGEPALDPAARQALERLPAMVRSRAAGGGPATVAPAVPILPIVDDSPDSAFDVLRHALGTIENRLAFVKSRVEREQALARATPSIWPIVGWLSSSYGQRRDPFDGTPEFHSGLDIAADHGTPIRATADGTIASAAPNGNYGNAVLIDHGFGLGTRFGHLSRFAVRPGQRVRRGEVIGFVGSTGRATSPHLHYEILLNSKPMNPLLLLARP
jgi:murein DD-endopeptidase MepM/ murein hydrolase activator NlpD